MDLLRLSTRRGTNTGSSSSLFVSYISSGRIGPYTGSVIPLKGTVSTPALFKDHDR